MSTQNFWHTREKCTRARKVNKLQITHLAKGNRTRRARRKCSPRTNMWRILHSTWLGVDELWHRWLRTIYRWQWEGWRTLSSKRWTMMSWTRWNKNIRYIFKWHHHMVVEVTKLLKLNCVKVCKLWNNNSYNQSVSWCNIKHVNIDPLI